MRNLRYLSPAHDVLAFETEDGGMVVKDLGNPGWDEAVALGPAPFVPPGPEPLTVEDYSAAVQAHVDAAARARNYHDGVHLTSYTDDPNPQWAAEAAAFKTWRSAIWTYVYAMWAAPPDPLPTPEELIAGLPEITWP